MITAMVEIETGVGRRRLLQRGHYAGEGGGGWQGGRARPLSAPAAGALGTELSYI